MKHNYMWYVYKEMSVVLYKEGRLMPIKLIYHRHTQRSCICVLAVMYLCVSGHVFVC
jgi:hypothetical protein